jgi:hypothetical protein
MGGTSKRRADFALSYANQNRITNRNSIFVGAVTNWSVRNEDLVHIVLTSQRPEESRVKNVFLSLVLLIKQVTELRGVIRDLCALSSRPSHFTLSHCDCLHHPNSHPSSGVLAPPPPLPPLSSLLLLSIACLSPRSHSPEVKDS